MFKGNKIVQEIKNWLAEFQRILDKAEGNQRLQFTAEIWKNDTNLSFPEKEYKLQVVTNYVLLFLDMIMSWSPEGDL